MSLGGGGSQTSTTVNQADPRIWSAVEKNMNRATGIADRPFEEYTGQFTTGLNGTQNMGINAAPGLLTAGSGTLNDAIGGARSLLNIQNPYTDQVVNRTLGDIEQQRQRAIAGNTDMGIAARAFGNNSRLGVADALTNEAALKQSADSAAALRSGGFDRQTAATAQGSGLLGQFGGQQQQMLSNGVGGLLQAGGVQQGTEQAGLDAQFQEFLRRINQPYQGQSLINQSLGLLPQGGTTTSTQPKQNQLGGIGSLLGGAASLIGLL